MVRGACVTPGAGACGVPRAPDTFPGRAAPPRSRRRFVARVAAAALGSRSPRPALRRAGGEPVLNHLLHSRPEQGDPWISVPTPDHGR